MKKLIVNAFQLLGIYFFLFLTVALLGKVLNLQINLNGIVGLTSSEPEQDSEGIPLISILIITMGVIKEECKYRLVLSRHWKYVVYSILLLVIDSLALSTGAIPSMGHDMKTLIWYFSLLTIVWLGANWIVHYANISFKSVLNIALEYRYLIAFSQLLLCSFSHVLFSSYVVLYGPLNSFILAFVVGAYMTIARMTYGFIYGVFLHLMYNFTIYMLHFV